MTRQVSLERLADDLELQPPTVRRACEARPGWLAEVQAPKRGEPTTGPLVRAGRGQGREGGGRARRGAKKKPTSKASWKAQAQPKSLPRARRPRRQRLACRSRPGRRHRPRSAASTASAHEAQLEAKVRENRRSMPSTPIETGSLVPNDAGPGADRAPRGERRTSSASARSPAIDRIGLAPGAQRSRRVHRQPAREEPADRGHPGTPRPRCWPTSRRQAPWLAPS